MEKVQFNNWKEQKLNREDIFKTWQGLLESTV